MISRATGSTNSAATRCTDTRDDLREATTQIGTGASTSLSLDLLGPAEVGHHRQRHRLDAREREADRENPGNSAAVYPRPTNPIFGSRNPKTVTNMSGWSVVRRRKNGSSRIATRNSRLRSARNTCAEVTVLGVNRASSR